MPPELRLLVRASRCGRATAGERAYTGRCGALELTAVATGIGTRAAAEACERLLASARFDRALVVGIAGGVAPGAALGELIVPERVLDAASGRPHRPAPLAGFHARGTLRTRRPPSDAEELARSRRRRRRARHETSAIARPQRHAGPGPCCARSATWRARRRPSCRARRPTRRRPGACPPPAPAPWRALRLARLARDSLRAARTAAAAAARACAAGTPEPRSEY
jgi:hypothetical protein